VARVGEKRGKTFTTQTRWGSRGPLPHGKGGGERVSFLSRRKPFPVNPLGLFALIKGGVRRRSSTIDGAGRKKERRQKVHGPHVKRDIRRREGGGRSLQVQGKKKALGDAKTASEKENPAYKLRKEKGKKGDDDLQGPPMKRAAKFPTGRKGKKKGGRSY